MATFAENLPDIGFDAQVFANLVGLARNSRSPAQAWLALEAAHVLGQRQLKPHLEIHALMLGLAVRTRDWAEAAGQLFRLALVPLGHVTGRLPLGNPGRSTVSAFQPLPVRPELVTLITQARAKASHTPVGPDRV